MARSWCLLLAALPFVALAPACSSSGGSTLGTSSQAATSEGGCCVAVGQNCLIDRDCCSDDCNPGTNTCKCSDVAIDGTPAFCAADTDCCNPNQKCKPYTDGTNRCQ